MKTHTLTRKLFVKVMFAAAAIAVMASGMPWTAGAQQAGQSQQNQACPAVAEVRALAALAVGFTGTSVTVLQRALLCAGFETPVNGSFNGATQAAVEALQLSANIQGNGGVNFGPRTKAALIARLEAKTNGNSASAEGMIGMMSKIDAGKIADAIGALMGSELRAMFLAGWQNYMSFLGEYTAALNAKDRAGVERSIRNFDRLWSQSIPSVAEAMVRANPSWTRAQAEGFLQALRNEIMNSPFVIRAGFVQYSEK